MYFREVSLHVTRFLRSGMLVISVLSAALLLSGCGSGQGGSSSQQQQPSITVNGGSQVRLGSTATFTATVSNLSSNAVTWSVNGVAGGNSTVGIISGAGVYTPPATIPAANPVTISAASVVSPAVAGTAQVSIWNPLPAVTAATATPVSGTSYTLEVTGSNFINGAQIQVGGSAVSTTFVSSTDLQAAITIPTGTITLSVTVMNPNPGAAASSACV